MDLPPDLPVVCRLLASSRPEELPALTPLLVSHVLRCGGALSISVDQKSKAKTDETTMGVRRLKNHISTHLNGKSPHGRFAAVALVKAAVDVGGWECLRTSESWVGGLLSILQVSQKSTSPFSNHISRRN